MRIILFSLILIDKRPSIASESPSILRQRKKPCHLEEKRPKIIFQFAQRLKSYNNKQKTTATSGKPRRKKPRTKKIKCALSYQS